jgi:exopolysaccharide/PEP-CTERM locus tyrosine autokinase
MSIIERALNKAKKNEETKPESSIDPSSKLIIETAGQIQDTVSEAKVSESPKKTVYVANENLDPKIIENLDWEKLASLGFLTPASESNKQTQEEYRNLKRPLINNSFGTDNVGINRPNLILVTSSVPGEGKTFTAINLAISIANERDKKVLLIDADVARPSVSKTLGIRSSPGLVEYLEGQDYEFTEILVKTNMPGLSVIPAGKQHKHSTELLTSNKMKKFAQEMSSKYSDRIIIFDSPPLLAATQAEALAALVGQIVLVVEAEKTPQSMVMASVNKLAECDVVLVMLNKTQMDTGQGYYNYGYGSYGH